MFGGGADDRIRISRVAGALVLEERLSSTSDLAPADLTSLDRDRYLQRLDLHLPKRFTAMADDRLTKLLAAAQTGRELCILSQSQDGSAKLLQRWQVLAVDNVSEDGDLQGPCRVISSAEPIGRPLGPSDTVFEGRFAHSEKTEKLC